VGYKWEKNGKSPTYIVDSRIWRTTCHPVTREGTFIGGIKTYYLLLVGGLEQFFHSVGNVIIPTDSYFSQG
jgi:hypothetical protein